MSLSEKPSQQIRLTPAWIIGILVGAIALSVALAPILPDGIDWRDVFRPAARELLFLRDPYQVSGFYYPTWALLPMLPFAALPEYFGRALLLITSILTFGYVAYRLGAKPIALGAFLLSPPVVHCLLNTIGWKPIG